MLIAMGIAAFLCIFNGTFYKPLYSILPYPALYEPYTISHIMSQTELLFYSALAFTLLLLSGIYPAEMRAVNIDFDWFYRKPLNALELLIARFVNGLNSALDKIIVKNLTGAVNRFAVEPVANLTRFFLAPFVKSLSKREPYDPVVRHGGRSGGYSVEDAVGAAFRTGTSPVGVYAACAGLFIVLLYLFL